MYNNQTEGNWEKVFEKSYVVESVVASIIGLVITVIIINQLQNILDFMGEIIGYAFVSLSAIIILMLFSLTVFTYTQEECILYSKDENKMHFIINRFGKNIYSFIITEKDRVYFYEIVRGNDSVEKKILIEKLGEFVLLRFGNGNDTIQIIEGYMSQKAESIEYKEAKRLLGESTKLEDNLKLIYRVFMILVILAVIFYLVSVLI